MELPFAVTPEQEFVRPQQQQQQQQNNISSNNNNNRTSTIDEEDDDDVLSLVTASTQGSARDAAPRPPTMIGYSNNNNYCQNHHRQYPPPPPSSTSLPPGQQQQQQQGRFISPMSGKSAAAAAAVQQQPRWHLQELPTAQAHQQPQSTRVSSATPATATSAALTTTQAPVSSAVTRISSVFSHLTGYSSNKVLSGSSNSSTAPTAAAAPVDPQVTPGTRLTLTTASAPLHIPSSSLKDEIEIVDFTTYVNVSETDANEVDIFYPLHYEDDNRARVSGAGDAGDDADRDSANHAAAAGRGDILTVLLSGSALSNTNTRDESNIPQQEHDSTSHNDEKKQEYEQPLVVSLAEQAAQHVLAASKAKHEGHLQQAVQAHAAAAKLYHEAALQFQTVHVSLANSLLLLSQTQAKSALALKRVIQVRPAALLLPTTTTTNTRRHERSNSIPSPNDSKGEHSTALKNQVSMATGTTIPSQNNNNNNIGGGSSNPPSQQDRIRATVRGALDHKMEADLSDSVFLGTAKTVSQQQTQQQQQANPPLAQHVVNNKKIPNPVDEMMELERQLRGMDMALELGSSMATLDARAQKNNLQQQQHDNNSKFKNSTMHGDGSFMVVPPSESSLSQSYMSLSMLWTPPPPVPMAQHAPPAIHGKPYNPHHHPAPTQLPGTAGARARANRVQSLTAAHAVVDIAPAPATAHAAASGHAPTGLESSWWGNSSTAASQMLTSSVMSMTANQYSNDSNNNKNHASMQPANTKQLMRLMDSLKTLGDENAALLRQVEDAEAARMEAKATKEQMRIFKDEYAKRFAALKEALEKFRKNYPDNAAGSEPNPVTTSEVVKSASVLEQLQRQDQLIRKLTADLKKEKEESKKKDAALRKYESFYREVKARSAQKAAQRQKQDMQPPQMTRQQLLQQQQQPHAAAAAAMTQQPQGARPQTLYNPTPTGNRATVQAASRVSRP